MASIQDVKRRFNEYQRANRFQVVINGQGFDQDLEIVVKSSNTPNSTNGVVIFPYRGRQIKYAGDRVYSTWTATVSDDLQHTYRRLFETWNEAIANAADTNAVDGADADVTVLVQSLDRNDNVTMEWTLFNVRITELGEIAWAQDSNDTIAEYTVTLDYDYHTVTA